MTPVSFNPAEWLALATAAIACVTDIRHRRVPNVLTFGAALLALVLQVALAGPRGALWAVSGWAVGLLLLLPVFAVRGMGGGDVKLLAAFGAAVGPRLVIWAGLYGAMAGGVLAVLVTLWHGVLSRTVGHVWFILTQWRVAGVGPVQGFTLEQSSSARLPYAVPLACGLVLSLWLER